MAWLDGHTRDEGSNFPATAMVTTPTKPTIEVGSGLAELRVPPWPLERSSSGQRTPYQSASLAAPQTPPSGRDALQALLAFSALHQQVRQRRALASRHNGFDTIAPLGRVRADRAIRSRRSAADWWRNAPLPSPERMAWSKLPRITGIRHWSSADSSTVVLDLEDQVQYEAHRLANPDRIYFDLHDTSLAPEIEGKAIDIGDRCWRGFAWRSRLLD
jgi:hypothetical protein